MDDPAPAVPSPDARLARWRERSSRVRRLRWALPAAMAALVLAVAAWITVQGVLAERRTEGAGAGGLHMSHPRFFGRDEGGRAFTLQAVEAVRDGRDPDRITLDRPELTLDYGGARPSRVTGRSGDYSQARRRLLLSGGVVMEDGKGAHMESAGAEVDTRTGDVRGRGGVTGTSPLGRFQASSYLVKGKGSDIVFDGAVRAHLVNPPQGAPAP